MLGKKGGVGEELKINRRPIEREDGECDSDNMDGVPTRACVIYIHSFILRFHSRTAAISEARQGMLPLPRLPQSAPFSDSIPTQRSKLELAS